jgi:hypothetical protein
VEQQERRYLMFFAPAAVFFPGLLVNGIILSGNAAYILYGAVLATALIGFRRGQWRWCYLAILIASCFKAPLLSLAALPLLSARRQWLPAAITTVAGVALFAIQPLLWPSLFHNFLDAVELQFSFNRDFGVSPDGIFSGILFDRGIPYSPACLFFYLLYAVPVFAVLFYFSRKFLRGHLSLPQWIPVMLLGVILLNPRLIEYDLAPLALPLAVIGWRFFSSRASVPITVACLGAIFAVTNFIAFDDWSASKLTACPMLVLFFVAGCFNLFAELPDPSEELIPMELETPVFSTTATSPTKQHL